MNIRNRLTFGILYMIMYLLLQGGAQAAPDSGLKDTEALHGLKVAKGVFMVDVKEPARMAHVLKVIQETAEGMSKQGVKPELIVVVIGRSVAFLTKDRRGISYLEQRPVTELQSAIAKLKSLGIRTEVCGIALRGMDVRPDDVIPDAVPVGNGYISTIGYQSQGYRLVPVY